MKPIFKIYVNIILQKQLRTRQVFKSHEFQYLNFKFNSCIAWIDSIGLMSLFLMDHFWLINHYQPIVDLILIMLLNTVQICSKNIMNNLIHLNPLDPIFNEYEAFVDKSQA